jgi:hypothetical protein
MMNLAYLVPRVFRHFMPESLTRFLLFRSVIIKPGLETIDPAAAVERYSSVLAERNESFTGKRVLVFGYGGRFDIGVGLMDAGADYVMLCDRYARPDDGHNRRLLSAHSDYLMMENGCPRPRPELMGLLEADVRAVRPPEPGQRYDLVLSSSVYEHVDDPGGITQALVSWTTPAGQHIHFVDLRDHFFKYPFEMLCYRDATWRRWLNPTSNHNRLRVWDYRNIFESHFREVRTQVLARDEHAFERIRNRIRMEFISGNAADDSVTLVCITARTPRAQG